MHFPRYWAKAEHTASTTDGKPLTLACWRWSDESSEDARVQASEAARALVLRCLETGARPTGRADAYGYADRPLREPVLERIEDADGNLFAAITRNAQGCQVLNTTRAMFVDVDFERAPKAPRYGKVVPLFKPSAEEAIIQRVADFLGARDGWGARVYRTAAGVRVLVTHAPVDIASGDAVPVFEALGADPLYVRLCEVQQSYRARLTPKHWRCEDVDAPPSSWPFSDAESEAAFERWQAEYLGVASDHATCRLVGSLGNATIHPEFESLIDLHDRATRATSGLPLA